MNAHALQRRNQGEGWGHAVAFACGALVAVVSACSALSFCAPEGTRAAILSELARAHVWLTPTLASWNGQGRIGDEKALSPERLLGAEFVSPALEHRWLENGTPAPSPLKRVLLSQFGHLAAEADRSGPQFAANRGHRTQRAAARRAPASRLDRAVASDDAAAVADRVPAQGYVDRP